MHYLLTKERFGNIGQHFRFKLNEVRSEEALLSPTLTGSKEIFIVLSLADLNSGPKIFNFCQCL